MHALRRVAVLTSLLLATQAGEYCDDFEQSGDFGTFWKQVSQDSNGKWEPTSYKEIKKTITDFPAPASGDTVMYLTMPQYGNTASARMETVDAFRFPKGSNISFRYWLRSSSSGSATLYAKLASGTHEDTLIIDLTSQSSPDNTDWEQVNQPIVANENQEYQIMIFATHVVANENTDNIAIDDIMISGPDNMPDRECVPITTTPATTTTEPTTTTAEPTTTTTEPTTTTTEPTTTAEPTTTTLSPPTTSTVTTAEPSSTTARTPPTTWPGHIDDRQYGPSGLLWVVFVVLGSSMVLALMLALTRQRRRRDNRPLLDSGSSGSSSGSSGSGWYQYVTDDPWTRLHGRLKRLWE